MSEDVGRDVSRDAATPAASPIPGVRWGRIQRHDDERGSFRELWRSAAFADVDPADGGRREGQPLEFLQSNLSTSALGGVRI